MSHDPSPQDCAPHLAATEASGEKEPPAVPFFRPELDEQEIAEVVDTLRSGWLTTGPKTARFEAAFAEAVGARHAIALNSCTAALHLATVALGLRRGQGVLIPTMTFAATAEVVRYAGAVPILVDCDPETLSIEAADAERQLGALRDGRLPSELDPDMPVTGLIPVHVAGRMLDVGAVQELARRHQLWLVEDAAHAFPAAWRPSTEAPWQRCGEGTADVSCFSFYANKTITTGEGGMATTNDSELAATMRSLSLHGLSNDAWGRYSAKGAWDYRILAPGYKYNLTDIASALGLHQLARAEAMRLERARIAQHFAAGLASIDELELPAGAEELAADPAAKATAGPAAGREDRGSRSQGSKSQGSKSQGSKSQGSHGQRSHGQGLRKHAWHLFQVRLRLERLAIDRDAFLEEMRAAGVGFSVHWRPLHLHPYYEQHFGWRPEHLPVATAAWQRTLSLPIFPAMTEAEIRRVIEVVGDLCRRHRKRPSPPASPRP